MHIQIHHQTMTLTLRGSTFDALSRGEHLTETLVFPNAQRLTFRVQATLTPGDDEFNLTLNDQQIDFNMHPGMLSDLQDAPDTTLTLWEDTNGTGCLTCILHLNLDD